MKLLMLNHNVIGRGGYLRAFNYGRELSSRGHNVSLVTISEKRRFSFEIIKHDRLEIVKSPDLLWGRLRSGWDLWDTLARIAHILPKQFDLIHCVDSRPTVILPGLALRHAKKIPLIIDWGDWWGRGGTIYERKGNILDLFFAPIETYFEEAFQTRADGVIVLTKALERRALSMGVKRNKLLKIDHGADTRRIRPIKRLSARKKLGLDTRAVFIGYLGVILKKDGELLIRSFNEVLRNYPKAKLLIIGNSNLSQNTILNELNKIVFTDKISYEKLNLYLAACDVMVLPLHDNIANAGRWPSKVCDYMAAGCPIVTCPVGDMVDLFSDGNKGILARDNPETFSKAIMRVIEDEDLKVKLGKNARNYAEKFLDWTVITDKLEKFYLQIIDCYN